MPKLKIKVRFSDEIKFECELPPEMSEQLYSKQLGFAVKQAINARADLADANLADANLARADLARADLSGAKNVPEINGTESIQESSDRAERQRQRAARFREHNPGVPVVHDLDATILRIVERGQGELNMHRWHTCETTHCRAGWAVHLAGEAGKALEERFDTQEAGRLIYIASAGRSPWFFSSDEFALNDMREQAELLKSPVT